MKEHRRQHVTGIARSAAETDAIAAFTTAAEAVFAANGNKVDSRLRFAIARESDEAVGPVRKFLGPAHLKDKDGPNAIRLTIVDVTKGKKYVWNGGAPGPISADQVNEFVGSFIGGSLEGEPVRG